MSYEQTNEFRKLQETSRMLSSREVKAYNSMYQGMQKGKAYTLEELGLKQKGSN